MAKVNGVATQLSGKVGQLIYRQTKYGTVVYEAKKASVPQRTEAQMQIRTQWGNLAAVYRQFNQTLKKGFEGLNGKMNDYNAFIQANTNVVKVYVPKSVRLNGGSVLAPYQITRGSMPSIAMTKNAGGVLVSDLNVGSLVIGEETKVYARSRKSRTVKMKNVLISQFIIRLKMERVNTNASRIVSMTH